MNTSDDFLTNLYIYLGKMEGVKFVVYKDTLGNATGGVGHLLNKQERDRYTIGSKISPNVVQKWLEEDVDHALNLARPWVLEFGFDDDYEKALILFTSVAFQLGDFKKKFPNTYADIVGKRYKEAISGLKQSLWMKQTPVRVKEVIDYLKTKV